MQIACSARSGPLARPLLPVACRTRNQPQILRAGGGRTGACRAGQRGSSARPAAIPRRQGITARRYSEAARHHGPPPQRPVDGGALRQRHGGVGPFGVDPRGLGGAGAGAIIPSPPCGRQGCGTCAARAASPSRSSRNHPPPPAAPVHARIRPLSPSVLTVHTFSGTGPAA